MPVEITTRCIQARYLLKPSPEVNDLILGVIGRAQSRYPKVRLYMLVVMSNHMHMLASAPKVKQISRFMNHVNGNIAKEIGKLHQWSDKFWSSRYASLNILDDEALIGRARYLLSNGVKEDLVEKAGDWPGVNCVRALCKGEQLFGTWVDRTREFELRRRKKPKDDDAGTRYPIRLSPLPCWADLPPSAQQTRWRHLLRDVEQEQRQRRKQEDAPIVGADGVRMQDPHFRPPNPDQSPQPICHASDPETIKQYLQDYYMFVDKYRELLEQLISGHIEALDLFPEGCFIPTFAVKRFKDRPRAPD